MKPLFVSECSCCRHFFISFNPFLTINSARFILK